MQLSRHRDGSLTGVGVGLCEHFGHGGLRVHVVRNDHARAMPRDFGARMPNLRGLVGAAVVEAEAIRFLGCGGRFWLLGHALLV